MSGGSYGSSSRSFPQAAAGQGATPWAAASGITNIGGTWARPGVAATSVGPNVWANIPAGSMFSNTASGAGTGAGGYGTGGDRFDTYGKNYSSSGGRRY